MAKKKIEKPQIADRILLGISGASGAIYAGRFLMHMKNMGLPVDVVVSDSGQEVLAYEEQLEMLQHADQVFDNEDLFAAPASGSSNYKGMVVMPCSMGTLARIAAGISETLLTRAADVCLKERKTLIVVPREMPFSQIHVENMLRIQRSGAVVIPASPSFYRHPRTIDDLVDTVLAKVLDQMGLSHTIVKPWREDD